MNGVAFRHFLTIENGFFKRCVVLTDSDFRNKSQEPGRNTGADFTDIPHIDIQVSGKHIRKGPCFSEQVRRRKTTSSRNSICITKPINGPKFKTQKEVEDIDVAAFFAEIGNYKAKIASISYQLLRVKRRPQTRRNARQLQINISGLHFKSLQLYWGDVGDVMAKNFTKPKLAEAGPGAGKTHTMVDEIVSAIRNFHRTVFLQPSHTRTRQQTRFASCSLKKGFVPAQRIYRNNPLLRKPFSYWLHARATVSPYSRKIAFMRRWMCMRRVEARVSIPKI